MHDLQGSRPYDYNASKVETHSNIILIVYEGMDLSLVDTLQEAP